MKHLLAVVVMLGALSSAQEAAPPRVIPMGWVNLQLGMDKQEVLDKFDRDTYRVEQEKKAVLETWSVFKRENFDYLGRITFAVNKLESVERPWIPNGDSNVEFARTLFAVVNDAYGSNGFEPRACALIPVAADTPTGDSNHVTQIICGSVIIEISARTYMGREIGTITETIMAAPEPKKTVAKTKKTSKPAIKDTKKK